MEDFYVLFDSISVITGQRDRDYEGLLALRFRQIPIYSGTQTCNPVIKDREPQPFCHTNASANGTQSKIYIR